MASTATLAAVQGLAAIASSATSKVDFLRHANNPMLFITEYLHSNGSLSFLGSVEKCRNENAACNWKLVNVFSLFMAGVVNLFLWLGFSILMLVSIFVRGSRARRRLRQLL